MRNQHKEFVLDKKHKLINDFNNEDSDEWVPHELSSMEQNSKHFMKLYRGVFQNGDMENTEQRSQQKESRF